MHDCVPPLESPLPLDSDDDDDDDPELSSLDGSPDDEGVAEVWLIDEVEPSEPFVSDPVPSAVPVMPSVAVAPRL